MFRRPARLIRNLHAGKPGLTYAVAGALWLMTTLILVYFLKIFLLADSAPARFGVLVFGLSVLAVHSVMSVYLGDGLKIRFRKQDRENGFIRFLGRFD
jgi:hypothetical protein